MTKYLFPKGNQITKGRKQTLEEKKRRSEGMKKYILENGRSWLFKKGQESWNKGKKMSEETRKRVGEAGKGRIPWNKGKKYLALTGEKNPMFGKFGRNHPRWIEIKNRLFQKQIRELFKYRQWRSDVFTRDDYTCQFCWIRGSGDIEADHIKQFTLILKENNIKTIDQAINCEELWNINNGRTLCNNCHKKTDTWGKQLLTKHQ